VLDEQQIGDDLLRLVFIACHPVLSTDARVALCACWAASRRTRSPARSWSASRPSRSASSGPSAPLAEAHVPFELPTGAELAARLTSVLEVIYLIFNEGYAATAGDDWMRPALCEDALRLGRVLAELMPNEPEVHGLVARVHVIEGVLALGAEQRMRFLEIPAVEQPARVEFGHQLLLGFRRRTPRRLAGRWSSASRSIGCCRPLLSPLRIVAQH
jgi:hypothetical protein